MSKNKKGPASWQQTGQGGDNDGLLSASNCTTSPTLLQAKNHARFNQLMTQATRQMELHIDDYGTHFLIWLSCYCAKNGLQWGPQT